MNTPCDIVSRGRRRDGKPRFWCLEHKADATGQGGDRHISCRRAHLPMLTASEVLDLDPNLYKGGIGAWGAVPPVYSTAQHDFEDIGIHIHARKEVDGPKEIDRTFRQVNALLEGDLFQKKIVQIDEEAAVYYMVSQVLGYQMSHVACSNCDAPHLDKDAFAVNPHRRHLCASCGHYFNDKSRGIGNPLIAVRDYVRDFDSGRSTVKPDRKLEISQSDFPNGIELWGSNQAILWTVPRAEEEGVHVHCYTDSKTQPEIDNTYDHLRIDGVDIDPFMLRMLMAQLTLPCLSGRVQSLVCPKCYFPHMDQGKDAHTPHVTHTCHKCNHYFSANSKIKSVVSNPMLQTLNNLADASPLDRRLFKTNLLPETD